MKHPQITVRITADLLKTLNEYAEESGTSRTDVVISAIAQYLGRPDNTPEMQRIAELERRMDEMEAREKVEAKWERYDS